VECGRLSPTPAWLGWLVRLSQFSSAIRAAVSPDWARFFLSLVVVFTREVFDVYLPSGVILPMGGAKTGALKKIFPFVVATNGAAAASASGLVAP